MGYKDKLNFDITNVQTILDSDSVGSYVRANDGTLITKHDKGLAFASVIYDTVTFSANFAGIAGNSISLVFNGTDTVATVVGIWNAANPTNTVAYSGLGTYVPAAGTAALIGGTDSHGLDTWILNPSIVVTAVNLDIRDLAAATDSVSSWTKDGTGSAITSTGGALDVNLKSPVVVDVKLDGIYTGTNLAPDNVGVVGFTRAITPGVAQEVEAMTVATLGTIIAADLSKIHALDVNSFLYAKDSTSGDMKQLVMDATNGGLNVNIKNSLTVNDAALANGSIVHAANPLTLANTAESVITSVLSDRTVSYTHLTLPTKRIV